MPMEPSNNNSKATAKKFIIAGLVLLGIGIVFGLIGALQYIIPGFLKDMLSFEKVRPLHVSSVVFWIIISAMGAVLSYVQEYNRSAIRFPSLLNFQFYIFIFSIVIILISYFFAVFGGREYWEFHPVLAIPIASAWILFIINFFNTQKSFKNQPVYVWMWITGLVFFLFTFIESYLWVFPYFRNNVINDMTIQWKSYGSMVGAWNMLIYGSSIFLMEKISGNTKYSFAGIAFALYFTSLFNLMFNWGHHIYTLPTHAYVKHISYAVSMTELYIIGRIIWKWKSSVSEARKHYHILAYRFIMYADVWVFLNLGLAILMSIPGINVFTHGTHVTVAHTMGTTIGINSMLLLAYAVDILWNKKGEQHQKVINAGVILLNISLFVFWISLIIAGILKARWQMDNAGIAYGEMMQQLRPYFVVFTIAGFTMIAGFLMVIYKILTSLKPLNT